MDIEPENTGMSELLAALDDSPKADEQETEQSAEPDQQEEATDQAEEQPQETAEPEVVDLDGKKLEIPPGTPPELVKTVTKMAADLKADYTRKTQSVSEAEKVVMGAANALKQQQILMGQTASEWADFRSAQQKVEQFKGQDWSALADQDPGLATKMMAAFQIAQNEMHAKGQAWQQSLARLNQETEAQREQQTAQRWKTAADAARQALGNSFTPQADKAAAQWLINKAGVTDEKELKERFADPVVLEAVLKAAQWDAAQGRPMKKVAEAPKVIKPAAPQPTKENQSALERLKKTGRNQELINFL